MTAPDGQRASVGESTAVNLAAKTGALALGFVVTPYVVERLGLRAFGFVALISAFSQYASLLDFGVGFTLTRAIAAAYARGDEQAVARRASSALWSSAAFGTILVLATTALVFAFGSSIGRSWPHGWQAAVVAVAVSVACTSVASVLQAFPAGISRWDLANVPTVANQLTYSAVVVVALQIETNLTAVALATAAAGVVGIGSAYVVYRTRWGRTVRIAHVSWAETIALWRYGLSVQTVNLVQLVNSQADKPVLLLFTNLQFVGLYELGSRVAFSIRALLLAAFGPLSVEAAGTMATGGRSAVARYYRRAYRTVALVGLAPIFALYGSSYALVILWLGPSDRVSGVIALVLGVGYAVNLSTGVGTALAMGAGRPDLDRNYSALGFALNVSLTVALGLLIGRWGVVIATALGLVLSSVWLLRSVDRWLGTRILSWRAIAGSRTAGELLLLALSLGFAITVCAADAGPPSRAAAAAYLGAGAAIFGIAWGWSASREGLLRRPRIVREILARIRSRAPAAQGELG